MRAFAFAAVLLLALGASADEDLPDGMAYKIVFTHAARQQSAFQQRSQQSMDAHVATLPPRDS